MIFAKREKISTITIKDFENIVDDGIKKRILDFASEVGLEAFIKESCKVGFMVLPKFYDENKQKDISEMIIKKLRLKCSVSNLKDYKKIRGIDQKNKFEHKHDYYFEKAKDTNYEARIYGDLVPNKSRESLIINNFNIVKNIFKKESANLILKLHKNDMFLVFDKSPNDEIEWENIIDLQKRLFKTVKFIENKDKGVVKEIIFARHSYALGDVDNVPKEKRIESKKEFEQLSDLSRVVLGRSPSTLKIIPVKMNSLGGIDIKFSKDFINLHN